MKRNEINSIIKKNYLALSSHDQRTFRNQMRDIFHIILYMASSAEDVVWNDIIDDEMQKPTKTNGGYDIF